MEAGSYWLPATSYWLLATGYWLLTKNKKNMKETIAALYKFQLNYLEKLVANIPEERLYEKQLDGFNSAGWILGHIYVEAEDLLKHLEIPYKENTDWVSYFQNTRGKIDRLENLPSKALLLEKIKRRYNALLKVYNELSDAQRKGAHPSPLIKGMLPNLDAWFAHHLTTHISIHCGNLVVWKKVIGIEINGY